ncbi:MAG: hypothetical protein NVV68_02685 [Dokdonella sp.]|nr:hypothetical protein [Dokdonella sp.]
MLAAGRAGPPRCSCSMRCASVSTRAASASNSVRLTTGSAERTRAPNASPTASSRSPAASPRVRAVLRSWPSKSIPALTSAWKCRAPSACARASAPSPASQIERPLPGSGAVGTASAAFVTLVALAALAALAGWRGDAGLGAVPRKRVGRFDPDAAICMSCSGGPIRRRRRPVARVIVGSRVAPAQAALQRPAPGVQRSTRTCTCA